MANISLADKEELELKPAYFIYPFSNEPLYDFSEDNSNEKEALVYCLKMPPKIIIIRNPLKLSEQRKFQQFIKIVKENFYTDTP